MATLIPNRGLQPPGHSRRFRLPVAALVVYAVACYRHGASYFVAQPNWHDTRSPGQNAGQSISQLHPAKVHRASQLQRSKIQMFGLLDDLGKGIEDVGKGIMKSATDTVTGMSEEERDSLLQKLMAGNMDFNDYVTMSVMMQRQGGAMGIMSTLSNIKGLKENLGMEDNVDTDDAESKLAQYSKIVGAMTEEQRANPGYYTVSSGAEENIKTLVNVSEVEEVTVRQFMKEFSRMQGFMLRIGQGMKENKDQETLGREIEQWMKEEDEGITMKEKKQEEEEEEGNKPYINPKRAEKRKAKALKQRAERRPPPPKPRPRDLARKSLRKGSLFSSGRDPTGW